MGTHPIFESDFDCLTESLNQMYYICVEDPLLSEYLGKNENKIAHFSKVGQSYYYLGQKNIKIFKKIQSYGQRLKVTCISYSELGKKVEPGDEIEIEGNGDLSNVKMSGKLVHIEERKKRTKRLKKKNILSNFLASFIPSPSYLDICGASEREQFFLSLLETLGKIIKIYHDI